MAESKGDGGRLHILEMQTQFGVGGITRHVLALRDWMRGAGAPGHAGRHAGRLGRARDGAGFPRSADEICLGRGRVSAQAPSQCRDIGWRLRRWLKAHRVDAIHAHESAPALVANLARRGLNIPLAVTYHGSEPSRIASFGGIAAKADLVITPSHRSAEDLARIGGVPEAKLKVLGLGVAPPPADSEDEVAALRRELLGDGDKLIITVARLEYQKGIDILIEAVARMIPDHPGFRFIVAGDGVDEEELKALARERGVQNHLRFLGRVNRPPSLPAGLRPLPSDLAVGGLALHHRRGVSGGHPRRRRGLFGSGGTH